MRSQPYTEACELEESCQESLARHAHEVGPVKTFLIVLVLVLVLMGAVISYLLELHRVLWPLQGLILGVAGGGRGRGWEGSSVWSDRWSVH